MINIDNRCFWCGKPMVLVPQTVSEVENMATIEHLIPKQYGGGDYERNLRLVHKCCNI